MQGSFLICHFLKITTKNSPEGVLSLRHSAGILGNSITGIKAVWLFEPSAFPQKFSYSNDPVPAVMQDPEL